MKTITLENYEEILGSEEKVNWDLTIRDYTLSEEIMRKYSSEFSENVWGLISCQSLTPEFIIDYSGKLDLGNTKGVFNGLENDIVKLFVESGVIEIKPDDNEESTPSFRGSVESTIEWVKCATNDDFEQEGLLVN